MSEFIPLSPEGLSDADVDISAEPVVSVEEWENAIEIEFAFPGFWLGDLEPARSDADEGFREIGISGGGFLSESGKPLMPSFGRFVQIPFGVDFEVAVANSRPVSYDDVLVTPAQENALDNGERTDAFEYDPDFYGRDAFYPENVVDVSGPQELDGYRVLLVHVRPLRYNPAKRTLSGYGSVKITFRLIPEKEEDADKDAGTDQCDPTLSREGFGNLVLNPRRRIAERIPSLTPPGPTVMRSTGPELIIVHDMTLKTAAEKLAKWKNQKGIMTKTVSIGTVRNSVTSIKKYIRQARKQSARLRYVLLFGDVAAIKTEQRGSVTTDHYYYTPRDPAGSSDCILPWVSGGRIPTSSLAEANAIVQQIVEYEYNPPCDPEYYRRMTAAAYFQDHNHDGRAERAYMKTMEGIRSHMVSLDFDVQRVYVSSFANPQQYKDGSTVPAEVRNAIVDAGLATQMLISETSEGQLLIGHRDHGGPSGWVDPPFQKQHLQAILSDYPTIFYSVNCSTGRFDMSSGDSFAEDILEHQGAAPTLVAATEDSGTWRNDSLMKGLFDAMWPGVIPTFPASTASYPVRHNRIGDILNYAKSYLLVAHGATSGVQHHFEIYHVVGDPTLQLWAREPMTLRLIAKIHRRKLSIRISPAAADCVVTIWYGKRLLKRISPASSQISLPLPNLELGASARLGRPVALEVCASAPGYRLARARALPVPVG